MIGWLLEHLFVDKKGRAGRKKLRRLTKQTATPAAPAKESSAARAADNRGPADDPEREQLINNAMTIFRQRRAEYEKLDDDVRARVDRAANKAFGGDDT